MNEPVVIRGGNLALPGGIRRADITLQNGKISGILELADVGGTQVDATGCWVIPGMIDVHAHGAVGVDSNHADAEGLRRLARFFASQGVTAFLPTVMSDSKEAMLAALTRIARAQNAVDGARVIGCHLEGPFLSPAYKGAMPADYLIPGDPALVSRFASAAGGGLLRMTVSPEVEGVEELLPVLRDHGVLVSMGHSGAAYDQTVRFIQKGVNVFTHTMNGMRPLDRHEPGILGAALEYGCYCEAILDGLHLHPGIVRLLIHNIGIRRLIGVTDSIMATGLADGAYMLGPQPIVVKDGDARLADGSARAGSTLTMQRALQNLVSFTGLPLEQAILPFTRNPAEILGIDKQKGSLAVGMDADVTVLDAGLAVRYTFAGQRMVYDRNAVGTVQ